MWGLEGPRVCAHGPNQMGLLTSLPVPVCPASVPPGVVPADHPLQAAGPMLMRAHVQGVPLVAAPAAPRGPPAPAGGPAAAPPAELQAHADRAHHLPAPHAKGLAIGFWPQPRLQEYSPRGPGSPPAAPHAETLARPVAAVPGVIRKSQLQWHGGITQLHSMQQGRHHQRKQRLLCINST